MSDLHRAHGRRRRPSLALAASVLALGLVTLFGAVPAWGAIAASAATAADPDSTAPTGPDGGVDFDWVF